MNKEQVKEKLHYLKYAVFHPFDGFYEIRFRDKGSLSIATIILILYGIMKCVSYQYTGFVMNFNAIHEMNSISLFISAISVLFLFIVSNWTVTTLFNGKGNMKNIYITLCYSLTPLLIMTALVTFLSNFVIYEEVLILYAIEGIAIVWFIFLMLAGLCMIHEYTFKVNLLTLAVTAVAAVIIVFLGVLFFTLIEQMLSFFISVLQEFARRIM